MNGLMRGNKSCRRRGATASGGGARILGLALGASAALAACGIVLPPDPPPEETLTAPGDFVWKDIEIARDYEFIGVTRIDCPKIISKFTGHGKCRPTALPFGAAVGCHLAHPGDNLQMACIDDGDVPAVYLRIQWAGTAGKIAFSDAFGACSYALAGPAAQSEPRFDADKGYKVCLFDEFAPYSKLRGQRRAQIPTGLYADFSNADFLPAAGAQKNDRPVFENPDALVLDARMLDPGERQTAFGHLHNVFEFYSNMGNANLTLNETSDKE